MSGIAHRGLKPVEVIGATRDHGDRLRYMAGCKCVLCRKANSNYESERQKARRRGDWNGIVPAKAARAHLKKLSRAGVGRRSVAAVSDVAKTVIVEVKAGRKKFIRARTERRILAVTPAMLADHATVPAGKTKRLIKNLVDEGYTKASISKRRGRKSPALQVALSDRVLVRTAHDIEVLHRRLTE